jgi:hypothetical protein
MELVRPPAPQLKPVMCRNYKIYMDKEWWRKFRTCKDLSHWFINHLVGLLISYQFNNQIFERVHTGFLLFHRNVLLWVTAGHVIDNIRELTSNPEIRTLGMSWLDGCDIEGAESVVVHDRNLDMFSSNNRGIDFGVINIAGLDEANILANDNVKIMTQQVWKNLGNAIPEGYYVLGFPKEWVEVQKTNLNNKQLFLSTIAKLA